MTEYNEGDLVEAVKSDGTSLTILRGIVINKPLFPGETNLHIDSPGYEPSMSWLEMMDFTITVIEKDAPGAVLNIVTPCHGAPILMTTTYTGGYMGVDEISEIECSHGGCNNSWNPEGVADQWNKATNQLAPEMFSGTLAALNALTIRKATP
jgi:hypothetical protein